MSDQRGRAATEALCEHFGEVDRSVLPAGTADRDREVASLVAHEGRQPAQAIEPAAQRLHQLQRDANAREVLVGIIAIVTLGIDYRQRRRQRRSRLVMIRDDEINLQLGGTPRRFDPPDSAIDRDHQLHTVGVQPIERLGLQAIPIAQPFGNEMDNSGAEQLERPAQDHRRRDAIDVVITMNRDLLFALNCREDPLHRRRHIG